MLEPLKIDLNSIFIVLLSRVKFSQFEISLIIWVYLVRFLKALNSLFIDSQIFIAKSFEQMNLPIRFVKVKAFIKNFYRRFVSP